MERSGIAQILVRRWLPLYLLAFLLLSCETDSYDAGEGPYSLLQADFAEVTADQQRKASSFLTDDGLSYAFSEPYSATWMTTADSTYRVTVYYNKVDEQTAKALSVVNMPTIIPRDTSYIKRTTQDPLGVESCWLTRNGKYINMGLLLMNGRNEQGEESVHTLAVLVDSVQTYADQTMTAYYRLLHDQGQAPAYYTNRRYVSILLPAVDRPDTVCLSVRTYNGEVTKAFKLDK